MSPERRAAAINRLRAREALDKAEEELAAVMWKECMADLDRRGLNGPGHRDTTAIYEVMAEHGVIDQLPKDMRETARKRLSSIRRKRLMARRQLVK